MRCGHVRYQNMISHKLIRLIHIHACDDNHETNNCFIYCMLSHGFQWGLYGVDGECTSKRM